MNIRVCLGLTILLFLCSCSMKTTQLSVLQAGQLDLPTGIETIATMDRSHPPRGFVDIIEGVATGEGIGQDRAGRRAVMETLTATLRQSPRYEVISSGIEQKKKTSRNDFDAPLPEDDIQEICSSRGAEALFALEYFDTDHSRNVSVHREKNKTEDGRVYYMRYYIADASTRVLMGWRLYYIDGRIIDEHSVEEEVKYSGRGNTEEDAISKLPSQGENIIRASREAGIAYGARIAPLPADLSRKYFVKSGDSFNDQMEQAGRFVQAGRWDEAAEIWKRIYYQTEGQQTKGRTAYNLALAGEAKGQLDLAKYWAGEAWIKHELKKAKHYIEILEIRIRDRERLERQILQAAFQQRE